MTSERPILKNKLLHSCCGSDFDSIAHHFHRVKLMRGRVLHHSRMPIEQVYFIESGLVVTAPAPDSENAPVGAWLIGNEGLAGLPVVLGARTSPHRRSVLAEGSALSIASQDLRDLLAEMPKLRDELLLYVHRILVEAAQTCACNARHSVMQRLARILLTAGDRLGLDDFPMTHKLLAQTLGTRRATVTESIHALENKSLILTGRDRLQILDRDALGQVTCACYYTIARAQVSEPLDIVV